MGDRQGKAPRTHFVHRTTTAKLGRDLDEAASQGLDLVFPPIHVGGRDWVLITRPGPILGPAGRRIFTPRED